MKILFQNKSELDERIVMLRSDKMYDRHYLDARPDSYPCVCIFHINTTYFGDHVIEIADFIYAPPGNPLALADGMNGG